MQDTPQENPGLRSGDASVRQSSDGRDHEGVQAPRERAGEMWEDAKETARAKLNEQKDAAAAGIGGVAGALRDAARRQERGGETDVMSALTSSAADGLDRLSGTLRSKDVGTMVRNVETFASQQPLAFFGIAVAVGFLGVRFIKASQS